MGISLRIRYYCVVVLISRCRNTLLSRKRKLRELYNYTALLNAAHQPTLGDWEWTTSEPNENERRFLDENDIAK